MIVLNYKWASEYLEMAKITYERKSKICKQKKELFTVVII